MDREKGEQMDGGDDAQRKTSLFDFEWWMCSVFIVVLWERVIWRVDCDF